MTAAIYGASLIKRTRSTKAEVEARREALLDIIDDGKPMTVRQVFYQATVRGLVEKAGAEPRLPLRPRRDRQPGEAHGRDARLAGFSIFSLPRHELLALFFCRQRPRRGRAFGKGRNKLGRLAATGAALATAECECADDLAGGGIVYPRARFGLLGLVNR